MSKIQNRWIVAAIILIALGAAIFTIAFAALDFDLSKISTQDYVTNVYEPSDSFDKIAIDTATANVVFAVSDDGKCKIECFELDKMRHSVEVRDGTLVIGTVDTRKWYDFIGINFGSETLTVSLPKDKYDNLHVKTDTGRVVVPDEFSFTEIEITSATGSVECGASVTGDIAIRTDTGKISINGVADGKTISVKTDVGRMTLTDVRCLDLNAISSTGNIIFQNVVAAGRLSAESDTGNVRFDGCDAGSITVKTDTGSVSGTLLSDKLFTVHSDIGNIDVPKCTSGGKCEITTDVGNITIAISGESGVKSHD